MTALRITPTATPTAPEDRAALLRDPGFGRIFTDHMAVIRFDRAQGWHDGQVTARAPFALDPAASVLHYAQEIFEGLKAHRAADGRVVLFRPRENARRLNASARRMAMPDLPEDMFIEAIEALVRADVDWIPEAEGSSLYLRPFMFASEAFLGVRPANEYIFSVIASPVGPYFKGGAKPVSIWVSKDQPRAAPGGTGAAKCGGNYAASLAAQERAQAEGCDQVLFLDATGGGHIEELGGMNIFALRDDGVLVTPPLTGTILAGITRDSLIQLARDAGHDVAEEPITWDQLRTDAQSGRVTEVFACGTAAVVAPIGSFRAEDGDQTAHVTIGDGRPGPVTEALRARLTGIQRGTEADPHGWVHPVA